MFKQIFKKSFIINKSINLQIFKHLNTIIKNYRFTQLKTFGYINLFKKPIFCYSSLNQTQSSNSINLKQLQKHVHQLKQTYNQKDQKSSFQYISALYKLAHAYQNSNKLQKAIQISKQLLYLVKATAKNKNSLEVAQLSKILQILHCKAKKYEQSIPFLQNCIKIKQILYGNESSEVADQHQDLATIYYYITDFQNAVKFYQIALKIRKDKHPDKDKQIKILEFLSSSYFSLKKYEQANFTLIQLQKLLIGNQKYNIIKLINVYAKLSSIKMHLHKQDLALEMLKKAQMLINSNNSSKNLSQTSAFIYKDLGQIYLIKRQFQEALKYLQKQLQLILKMQQSQRKAKLLYQNANSRLNCYQSLKNYQKAKQILQYLVKEQRVKQSLRKNFIRHLVPLGKIYKYQGNISEAKISFIQALKLLQANVQNEQIKFQKGDLYFQLAQIEFQQGNFKESIKNYQMTKQMLESLNNQNLSGVLAQVYVNLAKIQYFILKAGNPSHHIELLKKAQKIYLKYAKSVELQIVSSMLSVVLIQAKRLKQSIMYAENALNILQNNKKDQNSIDFKITKGNILNQLGKTNFQIKMINEAQKYLVLSEAILSQIQQSENFPLGQFTQNCYILSKIYKQQNKPSQQLKYLKKLQVLLQKNFQIHKFSQIKSQLLEVNQRIKKLQTK